MGERPIRITLSRAKGWRMPPNTRAEPRDRNALVPLILLGLAVGLLASGGSDAPCNGPDDTPTDGEGC